MIGALGGSVKDSACVSVCGTPPKSVLLSVDRTPHLLERVKAAVEERLPQRNQEELPRDPRPLSAPPPSSPMKHAKIDFGAIVDAQRKEMKLEEQKRQLHEQDKNSWGLLNFDVEDKIARSMVSKKLAARFHGYGY